jgi:hypothetical protein
MHRKIIGKSKKCKLNFVGIPVKNLTTSGSMSIVFPDNFCMKNRNRKNLDLLYLKIYKSSATSFQICGVLCYD